MSGITTHLCGLWCLKVLLMVLPSMPASSSKVQGEEKSGGRGQRDRVWKRVMGSPDILIESWGFHSIRGSDMKGTVKGQ